jgi:hypothetical protein
MCHSETGGQHHRQHHGQGCECQSESECGCQCGCCVERGGCSCESGCCCDSARGSCSCDSGKGNCCCDGGHGGFRRRFKSKAEVIAELESYLTELKAEAQAVEERIKELRA